MAMAMATPSARAAEPVAIIEDVQGRITGGDVLDELPSGAVLVLSPGASVKIGYLKSCLSETITGGRVTIGDQSSAVDGGVARREKVECDGGRMKLTAEQAGASGVLVFRKLGAAPVVASVSPGLTVFSRTPVILTLAPGMLRVERVDAKEAPFELPAKPRPGKHGADLDLAEAGKPLTPGGVYRVSLGDASVIFRVDANATSAPGALIGRMVRL